jgi:hypothetical protein
VSGEETEVAVAVVVAVLAEPEVAEVADIAPPDRRRQAQADLSSDRRPRVFAKLGPGLPVGGF